MSIEKKKLIVEKIQNCANDRLFENSRELFDVLGYSSTKRVDIDKDELEKRFNESQKANAEKALIYEWKSASLLFQYTTDEIKTNFSRQTGIDFSDINRVDYTIIESYFFFAIELKNRDYSRGKLSQITREVNKLFQMPTLILFKHQDKLTFSIIDRRQHKKDPSKEVLEKVTLIKDIDVNSPHRAHVEILYDLCFEELYREHRFSNWIELHRAWKKTLDISELNKSFYKRLANWYFWAVQNVVFPDDAEKNEEIRNATNVIRVITRIIFVWFLKEKRLVPDDLFKESKIKQMLKIEDKNNSTYYKAILQNLFFATLNTEMNKDKPGSRKFRVKSKKKGGRDQHYMIHNVFRYERYFRNPQETFNRYFDNIPFLNGGLFECLDHFEGEGDNKIEKRIDGFSDHEKNVLTVPDELFFSPELEIDLNEVYGTQNKKYKVIGLIDLLNSYKFTIEENTPIEEEVALDPELLGKVFENLLASYNPETKTTARKQTGSYYTPREIVNYMVNESLKAYLQKRLVDEAGMDKEDAEEGLNVLFEYTEKDHCFIENEADVLIIAIDNCRIMDPACGSGAFPMGILHKMVYILNKLDPENEKWRNLQRQKAIKETEEAFNIGNKEEREQHLIEINNIFENNLNDFGRKLYLIENCIFGVDIQPIAVQIAKLRFFISLLVEQITNTYEENMGIFPLPNLETKFVAANTLIGIDTLGQVFIKNIEVEKKEKELKAVRKRHFTARTLLTKEKYREQDKQIREEISTLLRNDGIPASTTEMLANWDPYDQNVSALFFDTEWIFGIIEGFDIVIGNPPYVQLQKNSGELAKLYKNCEYETFERTGDIYTLFYEKGIKLLKYGGHLCYISSNKWMRTGYGESLRKYFLMKNPKLLIDLGPGIFESATVDTNILLLQNAENQQSLRGLTPTTEAKDKGLKETFQKNAVLLKNLKYHAWFIGGDAEQKLKEKIVRIGKPLKEWDVKIYFGIKTGFNKAFIIDTATRDHLVNEDPKSTEILKPILRGRDIKHYGYKWAGLWLIATFPALTIDIEKYPAVKKYLLSFGKERLEQAGNKLPDGTYSRKKTGNKWYETQDQISFYTEFEKEKVVWKRIGSVLRFGYDLKGTLAQDSTCIMTGSKLKYFCAYMNSKLGNQLLYDSAPKTGTGDVIVSVQALNPLFVPPITPQNRPIVKSIEKLVDEIIFMKNKNSDANITEHERKIDLLVYKLYGLSENEIAIVEGRE
ncbi:Eco57I restriction-modification methylase domain-containing protein [candidate division KSB1 bacterium]